MMKELLLGTLPYIVITLGDYLMISFNNTIILIITVVDPTLVTPPPYVDPNNKIRFGKGPPQLVSEEDICPPPVICPTCPKSKETKECKEEFTIDDLLGHQLLTVDRLNKVVAKGHENRTLGKL